MTIREIMTLWRVSDLDEWAAGRPVVHEELGRQ